MVTYPLAVSAIRLIAVVQAVAAPFGSAPPQWVQLSLFAYAALATVLSFPPRSKPTATEDKVAVRPLGYAAIIALDVAAASVVAWTSGPSALALLPGFDAAVLAVGAALVLVVAFAAAFGVASALHTGIGLAAGSVQGLTLALGPYIISGFAMLLRRNAEQQIRAINHVLDAGSDMGTKLTMPEVLTQLLNMLKQFRESVPWQNVIVYIARYDDNIREETMSAEALAGAHADFYRGSKLRLSEGLVGYASVEQRPIIIADLQKEPREANLPKPKAVRGGLIVPIVSEGVTIGCVLFTSAIAGAYTFDQQRLVDRLIRLASVGIQNARLHSKTLELAETDSMTGLLTNRAYQERLDAEFRRSQSSRQSMALLIIDVDYFKHVNDTYGHPQGDELLRQLGEVIRQHARRDDICCRYGGDEFTIVMPQTIKAEAAMVAGRVRQAVEDKVFQLDSATAKITISIGVAGYPQDTATKLALIKAADDALYAAKQSGRNNVKLASRLLLQPKLAGISSIGLRAPTPIDSSAVAE
jgi:diguanylate cyclase (GGDEF)-like protein